MVVEYNQVDIVTSSINNLDYTTIKGSWIDANWLNNKGGRYEVKK